MVVLSGWYGFWTVLDGWGALAVLWRRCATRPATLLVSVKRWGRLTPLLTNTTDPPHKGSPRVP